LGHLLRLQEAYQGQAAFLFVCIRDAGHPDARTSPFSRAAPLDPDNQEAIWRRTRAGLDHYQIPFPGLLDEDGLAERAYDAYPKRLVIIGTDGLVVHDAGWGDEGVRHWDLSEVASHLRSALPTISPDPQRTDARSESCCPDGP
jgi:hypothetical protein